VTGASFGLQRLADLTVQLPLPVHGWQRSKQNEAVSQGLPAAQLHVALDGVTQRLHAEQVIAKFMTVNRKFRIVSFGSGPRNNAPKAISAAAKTGEAGRVLRALEPWGECRQEVVEAILAGDYEEEGHHLTVKIKANNEEEEKA